MLVVGVVRDDTAGDTDAASATAVVSAPEYGVLGQEEQGVVYVYDINDITSIAWTDEGSSNSVDLSNGAPSALAGLFLALSSAPVPFKGGTLLLFPFLAPVFVSTDGSGAISLSGSLVVLGLVAGF